MKTPVRIVACALLLALTGCFHRTHRPKQPALAPVLQLPSSPKPGTTSVILPPAVAKIPSEPVPSIPLRPLPEEHPHSRIHRHRQPAHSAEPAPANPVPEVSAIGQLSSGDPSGYRSQTQSSLASIERALDNMNSRLNSQQQKTAAHIREFLRQAHEALNSGDTDGAHTLAAKAKILLDELTR